MSLKGTATISLKELQESFDQPENSSQLIEDVIVNLKTNPSKHTLGWSHEPISRSFKEIFVYSHSRLEDKKRHDLLTSRGNLFREEVRSNLNRVIKGINALASKWEQELAGLEYAINDNYTNPVQVKIVVATPEEADFIKMIESLDYLLIILDNLWHSKEQSMEDKQRVTGKVIQRVSGLVANSKKKANTLKRIRLNQYDEKDDSKTKNEINTEHFDAEIDA